MERRYGKMVDDADGADTQLGMRRDAYKRSGPVEDDEVGFEKGMSAVSAAANESGCAVCEATIVSS